MKVVRLGDVCKVVSGSTPKREIAEYWDGTIPWVTPKEISRLPSRFLWESAEKITEAGFRSCSTAMLPVDSLLLSSRAPIGLLAINKIPVCTNQGFKSLIPGKDVHVEYLYYVLKANVSSLQAKGNGATFKELAKPAIENFEIPLPPLEDQIRIAHLLGKVEGLIAQRKQHLQQLDDLLKSVFLEMFGDPERNEKGWDKPHFESITSGMRNGLSPSKAGTEKGRVYTLSAVTGESFQEIYKEDIFSQIHEKYFPTANDFLVCRGNGNIGLVGKGYFYPDILDGVIFPDTIIAVSIQPNSINKHFFEALWKTRFIRQQIESNARTTNGAHKINQGVLEKLQIILPPVDIQNQFSTIVEKIKKLKSRYQRSLGDLEALYGALSQQAFKGGLDLSRVPLPDAEPLEQKIAEPDGHLPSAIHLPDTELLLTALDERTRLKELLPFWLEAYRAQANGAVFSVPDFLDAAQARIAELHPDNDFELGIDAYELVKAWVFDRISSRELKQTRTMVSIGGKRKFGNEVLLRVRGPSLS